jgi:diguanylate cyclase (GGDEF)-like protein
MLDFRAAAMFIDRFIQPELLASAEQAFRARVLCGIIVVYSAIIGLTIVYIVALAPIPPSSIAITVVLLLGLIGAYGTILFTLRQYGAFQLCCHLTTGFTALVIAGGVVVSGGPLVSPATPVNVIPIILAFVLLGQRAGLLWAQWVLLVHLALILLGMQVLKFPQLLDTRFMTVHHAIHWAVTYGAIIGLMMVFDSINAQLKRERDQERERLAHLASHDPLTDLPNRSGFDQQLDKSIARADRGASLVALLVLDLDGFKPVNDALGHAAGDKVLKVVSDRLRLHVRVNDTVARLGGDEFAMILEGVKDPAAIHAIALKINTVLAEPIADLPAGLPVTASIGVALYPVHTREKDQLVRLADTAMYEAKKSRNHCCLYDAEMAMARSEPAPG